MLSYEASTGLRDAILDNGLLNIKGELGKWLPTDLHQEHYNKWLEDMNQRHGGEFDNKFYRVSISPNVQPFLRIKKEVETAFSLERRRKTHTSPHLLLTRDPNIDPQLYTPSKRMRMMTSAVAGTSGSFVVGPSKVTSQTRIPAPVLEGPPALAAPNWDHLAEPDNALEDLTREELAEYEMKMKGDLRNSHQQIRATCSRPSGAISLAFSCHITSAGPECPDSLF